MGGTAPLIAQKIERWDRRSQARSERIVLRAANENTFPVAANDNLIQLRENGATTGAGVLASFTYDNLGKEMLTPLAPT